MQTATNYSKQFAAWATALQERYASDLYFRTAVNITTLQGSFVALCTIAFLLALLYPRESWLIFIAVLVLAALSGVVLSRFTLRPARDTAQHQKLFISNVAHELRTPLSTIKTSSEVALLDEALPAHLRQTFNEITEELNRVSEILNNLLSLNALTRPERMRFSSVDAAPLSELALRRLEPLARERGIKLVLRQEPGALVWGNTVALEQVMVNLVKNALVYTPANEKGVVTVAVRPAEAGMVLFSVADTGIGISQADLFHIFEPFYRVDTSRNRAVKHSGAGLGLTIVNEMVRAHRGRIHIESQKRKGTVVSVYLPRGGAQSPKTDPEHSEASIDFTNGK